MQRLEVIIVQVRAWFAWIAAAAGPALKAAWLHVVNAATRVYRSFVALVSSPMAWLAVGIVGYGAFAGGYMIGAAGKRALRADVVEMRGAVSKAKQERDAARSAADVARVDLGAAEKRVSALEAEMQRLSQRRPVAASVRAPRPSAPQQQPTTPWRPFQN